MSFHIFGEDRNYGNSPTTSIAIGRSGFRTMLAMLKGRYR